VIGALGPNPDLVLTLRVALWVPASLKSTTAGFRAHEECFGTPEQER
jgi:hypothetical protein